MTCRKNSQFLAARFFPLLILIMLLTTGPAAGKDAPQETLQELADLPLEELLEREVETVTTASRYRQLIGKAPAAVAVITAEDIKRHGWRTLADCLMGVRDFYVSYDRNYHYLGSRGFSRPGDYNTRYLLLVDGHRLNDAVYDQAAIGTDFPLDVDLIGRIEIVRGPVSVLYGSNALLGVINVITRELTDMGTVEISGEAASHETYKGRLSIGLPAGSEGNGVMVSGTRYRSGGKGELFFPEFDRTQENNGIVRGNDSDENGQFFFKAAAGPLLISGGLARREKDIPTAPWDTTFGAPGTKTADERGWLNLFYTGEISSDHRFLTRLWYNHYRYEGDYVYVGKINRDLSIGDSWGAEVQMAGTIGDDHRWTVGAEYNGYLRQDQKNWDDSPHQVKLDDQRHTYQWAVYLAGEIKPLENLFLNVGARFDRWGTFGNSFNPRLGLVYAPLEATHFKLLYGTAFRAPNVYELYYNDGNNTTKSNPELKAETISSYDAVIEHSLSDHTTITATVFKHVVHDLIALVEDPADGLLVFRNIKRQETTGVSAEVEKRWRWGMRGRVGYTYQDSEDEAGNAIVASPRHLYKVHLQAPFFRERLVCSVEGLYVDSRKNLKGTDAPAYFLTNVSILVKAWIPHTEASLSIYDLFDKRPEDPASSEHRQGTIPQDGRSLRLKLTWRF